MKKFRTQEIRDLFNQVMNEEISFSCMVEILNEMVSEEPRFKDGDFVYEDGRIIIFKSYPNNYHCLCLYYPHIGKPFFDDNYGIDFTAKSFRRATEEEKQTLLDELAKDGKRWNAEKLCIEDIPVCKFKKGNKVRIKHDVSSKTHKTVCPFFNKPMDDLINKTMTVSRYTHETGYVVCMEAGWWFREDWIEPYEELKEGDLAIFWDVNKGAAFIGEYNCFHEDTHYPHEDNRGNVWANAIKFESKEQFKRLINGEI